jgi:ubiquinone biosynthesis UbiH/UbiF/VisC/COQ6 family hydroxylase
MEIACDIAVIGAGPAGLSFACAIAGSGLDVLLVERAAEATLAEPAFDGREIALTHRSQAILQDLGVLDRIAEADRAPMREARVLNGASPFALSFSAPAEGGPLGTLVPNHAIRHALWEQVQATQAARVLPGVAVRSVETAPKGGRLVLDDGRVITARLVIAADTRMSEARRQMGIAASMKDFGKSMLVARVAHEKPHDGIATEWFGHGQTLAMLPLAGDVSSVVLTLSARRIQALMEATPETFSAEVTQRTDGRWGALTLASTRHAYPLVVSYARRFVGTRFALLGDAAVGMHPVTAHGFNFGLAGAQRLAEAIRGSVARGRDIADPGALLRFEMRHRAATFPLFTATNAIAGLYTDDRMPARLLREAVLRAGGALSPVRRLIASQLMEARA